MPYSKLIYLFVILFFIGDAVTTVLYKQGMEFYRFSLIIRMFFEILCLGYLIINAKKYVSVNKALILIICLSFFYFIGNDIYFLNTGDMNIVENIILLNKYLFFFIVYYFIYMIFKDSDTNLRKLFNLYETIIILNSILIFIGFIFKIDFLKSYGDFRFGYKGLIFAQNEVSLFYLIAFFYSIYKFRYENKIILLLVVLVASFLLGTKVGMFLIPSITLMYFMFFYKRWISSISITLLGLILLFFIINVKMLIHESFTLLIKNKAFAYVIYHFQYGDFMTALFSGRNNLLYSKFIPDIKENWNIINYLFGGTNLLRAGTEMDLFDLFLSFGIMGSLLYLYLLYKVIIFKNKYWFSFILFIVYLITAFLSGHFFTSALNSTYLAILILAYKLEFKQGIRR